MSKLRTTTSTALATMAIGSIALVSAPNAQAQIPGGADQAPTPVASQPRELPATGAKDSTQRKTTKANTSELRFGQRSEAIRELQTKLTNAGFDVPATGYFGTITQGALRDFQASEGLTVTGRATQRTLSALGGVSAETASTLGAPAERTARTAVTSSVESFDSSASSAGAQAAVDFAYAQLGTPYAYGGTGNGGYDCSGLTQAAWSAAGVSIPRTSFAQWGGLTNVSTSNLQPGDLVVFYGGSHIGIYVGDGDVIHAPRPGKSVEKVSMSTMPASGAVRPA